MHGLSAHELLYIWEAARTQHPVDRALIILAEASPEVSRGELLNLSIGQRDIRLLAVREQTFGSQLAGFSECVACRGRLEFTINVADIGDTSEVSSAGDSFTVVQEHKLTIGGYELRFRVPNSLDLAEIVCERDTATVYKLLIQRCVVKSTHNGVEVAAGELPEEVVATLADRMAQCDPQADIQLSLCCPDCDSHWSVMFDIVTFFWTEICAQAKRLLREVHTLASAYGWREDDILSMSTARRQFYLEMVT